MQPRNATIEEVNYWSARELTYAQTMIISGPGELEPDVIPCPAVVMPNKNMVAVVWELDEIELAQLAKGGKLWLTTYGGLPIHNIEVISKEDVPGDSG